MVFIHRNILLVILSILLVLALKYVLFQIKSSALFVRLGHYNKSKDVSPAMHHIDKGENVHAYNDSVRYSERWTEQWLERRETALQSAHHKKLLLFCHMRGGSTFFSEFFRQNSEVMYWYEPIASLYAALYGQKKWQFPLELFFREDSGGNFTLRTPLPAWEVSAIAEYNHHLLRCDFNQLPVELFVHKVHPLSPALKCMQEQSTVSAKETGYCALKALCKGNIATAINNNCANHIRNADRLIRDGNFQNKSLIPKEFLQYSNCKNYHMENINERCLPPLASTCSGSKLVVYKGLRLMMESVDAMLQRTPDMHVIYFMRDPRSIVTSRMPGSMTFSGSFKSAVIEAKYLCQKMLNDYKIYKELDRKYPGAFTFVRYEDLVKDRYQTVKNIYKYLDIKIHQSLFEWIKDNLNVKKSGGERSTARANSTASLDKWRRVHSLEVQQGMTKNCEELLNTLGYESTI